MYFFESSIYNLLVNLFVIIGSLLLFNHKAGSFLIPFLIFTNTIWVGFYLLFSYSNNKQTFSVSEKGKFLFIYLILFFSLACTFWLPHISRKLFVVTIFTINIIALILFIFRKVFRKNIARSFVMFSKNLFRHEIIIKLKAIVGQNDKKYYSTININQGNQANNFTYNSKNKFLSIKNIPKKQRITQEKVYENSAYTFDNINFGDTLADWAVSRSRSKRNIESMRARQLNNRILKRGLDIFITLFVIVFFLSWLIPIIGLLIKVESSGPIFFKQLRSGLNNQPFWCYKFRSMRVNERSDELQATRNDNRITKLGFFLRKTSIDEFPQFINVLKGEMSVVGPRPHMLLHTEEYGKRIKNYMNRLALKQGLTGLAQVKGYRGETADIKFMEDRIEYDLWYVKNWSFWLDIKIIFLTIIKIFKAGETAF